jgi:hypothetical protein
VRRNAHNVAVLLVKLAYHIRVRAAPYMRDHGNLGDGIELRAGEIPKRVEVQSVDGFGNESKNKLVVELASGTNGTNDTNTKCGAGMHIRTRPHQPGPYLS